MPTPPTSTRYPSSFRGALEAAASRGSLSIPAPNPSALRFQFYGFIRALRREGQSELADSITFTITPGVLTLRYRDTTDAAEAVSKALANLPPMP